MPFISSDNRISTSVFYDSDFAEHPLGTRLEGHLDTDGVRRFIELVYVQAITNPAINGLLYELPLIYGTDAYKIDTALTLTNAATILGSANLSVLCCVPVADIAVNSFGWVAVRGVIPLSVAANAVKGARLYLTATAGVVDDTDTDYILQDTFLQRTITTAGINNVFAQKDLTLFREA
jgi:hypothetical protein